MITNYGGKLSACIRARREGGRVGAAFLKREAAEGVNGWKKNGRPREFKTPKVSKNLFFSHFPLFPGKIKPIHLFLRQISFPLS